MPKLTGIAILIFLGAGALMAQGAYKKKPVSDGHVVFSGMKIPVYGDVKEVSIGRGEGGLEIFYTIDLAKGMARKSRLEIVEKIAKFYSGKTVLGIKVTKPFSQNPDLPLHEVQQCDDYQGPKLSIGISHFEEKISVSIRDHCGEQ